ncbi:uncharacterized protein ACLA_077560 [Aspergillus clavatus NRRL 1]|uniref:Integral membrane protein n=1 Tax=Aspergillus clavatus (strain ATCC 1007 / CBS 513.65 / DSM 816 / NCTC 3887 / NRRL 1 / QM 1276 / 107) TaxID=344612 RepID=A1CLN0_ASPCL|nr:uncharacterized protein ACLA_077560 [Aspergillus clavatus NRRL 1]EAW09009.1 hypothetical protein ACLA_077560 [Aspergillus clavatus NRRL 1]
MPIATALPSGINGPPTVNRADNHSGLIVVITGFCLVLVISSLCARAFSSYKRHIVQRDDYGFGAVVVVALVQTSLVLAQVHYGWGTKEDTMSPREKITALKTQFARWQAITAMDIILESLLVLHSGHAICGIKISRRQKIVVFGTLSCRLILLPLAAIHLHYIQVQLDSVTPTLEGASATITAELYLALSVVCLVASFMKPVLAVYVDEYGIAYTDDVSPAQSKYRSHTSSGSGSRRLGTVDYNYCWQRMLDPPRSSVGNRIVKTVQISVSDGPIELPERQTGEIS